MKVYPVVFSNGQTLDAIIDHEELLHGITAVAISNKARFLPTNTKNGVFGGLVAYHPTTKEELKVLVLNDSMTLNSPFLIVPAHSKKHYLLAKKYGLPKKQVVAPYFLGTASEKLREGVETVKRKSVIVVVKHHKKNTYLCVSAKKRLCKSFVLGGIENGETLAQAAVREVQEETGYKNIKITRTSIFELHNHFYADYKNVNRYAQLYVVFAKLENDDREKLSYEEEQKHEVLWVKKNKLKTFLSVASNLFVEKNLLKEDLPYTGDGILVNSADLNGLTRMQAKQKIFKH